MAVTVPEQKPYVYASSGAGYRKENRYWEVFGMAVQRIMVGYVELTETESEELFQEVKKDKEVESYDALQALMEDFDSRIIEPETKPLKELLDEEAPTEEANAGTRYIEIFNKLEEDSRYRIKSSKQD